MTLPREVKRLLEAPPTESSVHRTWVRLERTRASRSSPGRLVVLSAALAASVAGFMVSASGRGMGAVPPLERLPPAAKPGLVGTPSRAPAPLASAMLQGRVRRAARFVHPEEAPADPVGHLLEGAVRAFSAGDAATAAARLSEAAARHPDDARIPEALVTLGWLQLEHLDAPLDARASLERAMASPLSQELFDRAWPLLQRAQALTGSTDGE